MFFTRLIKNKLILVLATVFSAAAYLWQVIHYADSIRPSMDEGMYLIKGFLMASGVYPPYQPFGLWMNKMPLSFLIPGWAQMLFGQGMRTGRLYAVILAILIVVGLWLLVYRLSGPRLALLAVLFLALNPIGIKVYSQAISQVLVAAMLVWSMLLLLGEKRSMLEIGAGSALAACIVLTRENMAPLMPFFLVLVFLQNGKKKGWMAFAVMTLVFLGFHTLYFPDILQNWAKWIPQSLTPFLDPWRVRPQGLNAYVEDVGLPQKLFALAQGLRWNFIPTVGLLLSWSLVSWKKLRNDRQTFRITLVLSLLFLTLMAMHAWAALGNDYCTFCFSGYLAFFNPLAILVVILLIPAWDLKTRPWWRFLSAAVTGGLLALIGYGNFEDFYDSKNFSEVLDFFFKLPLPWLRDGRLTFGDTLLWQVLANKFGLTFEQVRLEVLPMLIPAVLALAIFAATLIAVFILVRLPFIKKRQISFASLLLLVVLTAGIFLSPTPWLGGGFYTYDCRPGIVNEIEEAGQQLRELIPAGSTIYWRTNRMPIIMLTYLDSPNLFPPQLNGSYSFLNGGDSQQLARYGFWNQELSDQWLAQADYAFINAPSTAEMLEKIDELHYQPLAFLTRPFQCGTEQTTYLLFKK